MEEKEIVDYIKRKVGSGNLLAFNILINITYNMILKEVSSKKIMEHIDELCKDPFK